MKLIFKIISILALIGVTAPPVIFFLGQMNQDTMKTCMLIATIFWFVFTPFWMKKEYAE